MKYAEIFCDFCNTAQKNPMMRPAAYKSNQVSYARLPLEGIEQALFKLGWCLGRWDECKRCCDERIKRNQRNHIKLVVDKAE